MASESDLIARVVSMLVQGHQPIAIETLLVEKLGLTQGKARAAVRRARAKLAQASRVNRDVEMGVALTRINNLYQRAMRDDDVRTSLAAQKELNRLLELTGDEQRLSVEVGSTESERELALIAQHLLPLGLADADQPLHEHARIAAELVITMRVDAQRKNDKRQTQA